MLSKKTFGVLSPDLQVSFYYRLKDIKELYFHEALSATVKKVKLGDIDKELSSLVSEAPLQKLASFSLRGEIIFPLPVLLEKNPYLIGYYRLLYGFSQKEFYSKGPFGIFKLMEEKGVLTANAKSNLKSLCESLIKSGEELIKGLDQVSVTTISELLILTVGPQLRGSKNNEYGQIATQRTFSLIKEFVRKNITASTSTSIELENDSGRIVTIEFSSDPDIEITEKLPTGNRGLVSIEIKGGTDLSNIHNRVGEAEKSHQKAKKRGYFEFMTIINVDINYAALRNESPTTSHFFHIDRITDKTSEEYSRFRDILSSMIGVKNKSR